MAGLQFLVYGLGFLGVLVTVHEAGHFFAAKWAGVKVLTFSLGFGPKMFGFRRGDTMYQIAWLPIGGYVRMAGQIPGDDLSEDDEPRSFMKAPWWKRFIILAAGPAANFLFPVVAFFFVMVGDRAAISSRVGWVEPGYPAAVAGILPGDKITSIDGVPIATFSDIREAMDKSFERPVAVSVLRDGQTRTLNILPRKDVEVSPIERKERGMLGIGTVPPAALLGVPPGSTAETFGLKTFDRVLKVGSTLIHDRLELDRAIRAAPAAFSMQVVRTELSSLGTATVAIPQLLTIEVQKSGDVDQQGLKSLGAESADLYVWTVAKNSVAEKLGIVRGDKVLMLNDEPLTSWVMYQRRLAALEKAPFEVTWLHGETQKRERTAQADVDVFDEMKRKSSVPDFGIRPVATVNGGMDLLADGPTSEMVTVHMSPAQALVAALKKVPEVIGVLTKLILRLVSGGLPVESIGGPIMLFQVAVKSAEAGIEVYLQNMALLSVNLGLVNLLPIPILDGFGLIAAAWEGIRRRPLDEKYREVALRFGFVLLVGLMLLAFRNDLTAVFFRE
jgi:regulator of sigma E protease